MTTVAVIMSTYNGEKFLREQLDSILAQRNVEVTLFVRDDGSKDGTQAILSEYAEKYGNIRISFEENVGVGNSFMNALYATPDTFDFYAFADQDDIWLEDKLAEAAKMLRESGKYLYASNQECVDDCGNIMKMRYEQNADIHLTPAAILQRNMLAGCTMVFTNMFYHILVQPEHRPSVELLYNRIHDVWVAFTAALYDKIIYDPRSFMHYRQHTNNVVGIKKHRWERWKKMQNKDLRNGRSFLAEEACAKFPTLVKNDHIVYMSANVKSAKGKRNLMKARKEICGITGESLLGFIVKVLCGLY